MFTLNSAKTKLVFEPEETRINNKHPDPNKKPGLKTGEIKNLVIHPVQASSMQNAINRYLTNANSLHLLINRNGKQIAQMRHELIKQSLQVKKSQEEHQRLVFEVNN